MNFKHNFDPEGIIRYRIFTVSDEKIIGMFYENEDGKFIISFIKGMDVLKEIDVTDEWLSSKSIHGIDAVMNAIIKSSVVYNPW